ncbi:hypothetical protein ACFLTH_12940 [Bacteroidota bacterium]
MLNLVLSIMLFLLPGSENSEWETKNHKSYAYDLETDEFLYTEVHQEIFKEAKIQEIMSDYINAEGELLSKRILKFGSDPGKPYFRLEDLRNGYIEGAEVINTGVVRVFIRESFDDSLEEEILRVEEPFVIDGGMTFFFHQNWDRLVSGETVYFNFIIPSAMDYFEFRAYKEDTVTIAGRKGMKVKLEIADFILRAFVDPFYISYALDDMTVLYYSGISNVKDEEGNSYNVNIDYTFTGDKQ